MAFGSHSKPEVVTNPYALFQVPLPAMEVLLLAETIRFKQKSKALM